MTRGRFEVSERGMPVVLRAMARRTGGATAPAVVTLDAEAFSISVEPSAPWSAAYRDLRTVAVDGGVVLIELAGNDGHAGERWLFERLGEHVGTLVRGLRDGRLRQWLDDAFVRTAPDAEIELVEYAIGDESGVAQLLYHDRGVVLAPLDERCQRRAGRRADIAGVELRPDVGGVRVHLLRPAAAGDPALLELRRLGGIAGAHRDRWVGLRDAAAADAAAIVEGLMPDKPHPIRALAASALREGRPVAPAELGDAWGALEAAILVDPAFAASYRALCEIAGDHGPGPWIAAAPRKPGDVDEPLLWTFVALPANLVALELVSGGAHATYFFRVVPRRSWTGTLPAGAAEETVAAVSDALVDARFLREPLALPDERLGEPANVRYRLALAALPSLAAARRCFVARVVHRDAETWRSAVEDLVAWHARATDDEARWPGRAAQEALVAAASDG